MRHTCPGGWWKGRKLNEIMKPMFVEKKHINMKNKNRTHRDARRSLPIQEQGTLRFRRYCQSMKTTFHLTVCPSLSKIMSVSMFPLVFLCASVGPNCWPTKAINVYDETVSVMIESPHLDISNKNSKKTKLLYVGLCLCVSFMHKSYVYTSLIIYKIIYDLC